MGNTSQKNKLMINRGAKGIPFHPTMRISRSSRFCRNQWALQMFKPNCFVGDRCPGPTVQEIIEHYFKELQRTGHKAV